MCSYGVAQSSALPSFAMLTSSLDLTLTYQQSYLNSCYSGVGGYWGEVGHYEEVITTTTASVSKNNNTEAGTVGECDELDADTIFDLDVGECDEEDADTIFDLESQNIFPVFTFGDRQEVIHKEEEESTIKGNNCESDDISIIGDSPDSTKGRQSFPRLDKTNAPVTVMSRKSARLSSKGKYEEEGTISNKCNRKRKAEDELEEDYNMNKRTKQYTIENQWIPLSENSSIPTSTLVPSHQPLTPESEGKGSPQPSCPRVSSSTSSHFRFRNIFTPIVSRNSPLPQLSWADSREVWQTMLKKESHYVRDPCLFHRHPNLQSRMRAILLDWMIEVCEVYKLHRESFYLAVDFVDRFMSKASDIQKQQLQLIGITCLFIAAKLEEIYPPKLSEFAFVTDGACTEDEILDQELVILKALKWDLSPMTTNGWLNLYLQVANAEHIVELEHGFVYPQYSSHAFVQISRLLDLCVLDIGSLQFSYSSLAAAALYHLTTEDIALAVSGFLWQDIAACAAWMAPFASTLQEVGPAEVKFFPNICPEDCHHVQTHQVDLTLLEKAQEKLEEEIALSQERSESPDPHALVITQLTPPSSNKKSNGVATASSPYSTQSVQSSGAREVLAEVRVCNEIVL